MKQKFINNSVKMITTYNSNYTDYDLQKLRYGLEGVYLTVTKVLILLLIAFIFQILPQVIFIMFLSSILRLTGFGFHAEKSYICLIFSIINFNLIPLLLFSINLSSFSFLITGIICIFLILLYAPADTPKRPLKNKKKRIIWKFSTVIIACIYVAIGFYVNNETLTIMLLSALIIQAIMILPITYSLFKTSYSNYKTT